MKERENQYLKVELLVVLGEDATECGSRANGNRRLLHLE